MENRQAADTQSQETVPRQDQSQVANENVVAQDNMAKRGSRRGRGHMSFAGSPQDRFLADAAVQQIEYLFSVENLCRDTYLRSFMDAEGYVPIAMVCNFPLVASYGASYPEILARLEKSETLETHDGNETVRPLDKPQQWVFPTPAPMWIKLAPAPSEQTEDDTSMSSSESPMGRHHNRRFNNQGKPYHNRNNKKRFGGGRHQPRQDATYQNGGQQRQGQRRTQQNARAPAVETTPPPFTQTEFPPLSTSVC